MSDSKFKKLSVVFANKNRFIVWEKKMYFIDSF